MSIRYDKTYDKSVIELANLIKEAYPEYVETFNIVVPATNAQKSKSVRTTPEKVTNAFYLGLALAITRRSTTHSTEREAEDIFYGLELIRYNGGPSLSDISYYNYAEGEYTALEYANTIAKRLSKYIKAIYSDRFTTITTRDI